MEIQTWRLRILSAALILPFSVQIFAEGRSGVRSMKLGCGSPAV